jgi:hypothetical protein
VKCKTIYRAKRVFNLSKATQTLAFQSMRWA